MKKMLHAAALIILTALVIIMAAHSHDRVKEKCSKEWTTIPGFHHGLAVN
jgi:hypothetical protein